MSRGRGRWEPIVSASPAFFAAQPYVGERDRLAQEVGRLTRELQQMRAEYLGTGQKPQAGCEFGTVFVGDATVLVEFERQRAEKPNYDADSRSAGPGCPESIAVIQALVNGIWIDARDYFTADVVEGWEQGLLEETWEQGE